MKKEIYKKRTNQRLWCRRFWIQLPAPFFACRLPLFTATSSFLPVPLVWLLEPVLPLKNTKKNMDENTNKHTNKIEKWKRKYIKREPTKDCDVVDLEDNYQLLFSHAACLLDPVSLLWIIKVNLHKESYSFECK